MCFAVLPPNRKEREEIFKIHIAKRKQDVATVDMPALVDISKGFVGAEIEAAVSDAVKAAWFHKVDFSTDLVVEKFSKIKPISVAFPDDFNAMVSWAQNNAQLTSTPEPDEAPMARSRTRGRNVEI
jgi:SpoVK/Ycf46/Vps4 family AAA+-type ATPase